MDPPHSLLPFSFISTIERATTLVEVLVRLQEATTGSVDDDSSTAKRPLSSQVETTGKCAKVPDPLICRRSQADIVEPLKSMEAVSRPAQRRIAIEHGLEKLHWDTGRGRTGGCH